MDDGLRNSDVKVDESVPAFYSVTHHNGLPIQMCRKTGKSGIPRKGVNTSSKKKITITLRDLTSFNPVATGRSLDTTEQVTNRSKKQLKERPLGLVHSLQLNLVPSKSLPSLTRTTTGDTKTTTTTCEKTNPKLLHIKPVKHFRYSSNQIKDTNKERINYCDRKKTKMILQWLADIEAD